MSNFTPGPWSYNHDVGTIETAKKIVGYNRYATTDAETEANGRLMAAAPDLLEACEASYGFDVSGAAAVEMLRAAIVKATGKQPR